MTIYFTADLHLGHGSIIKHQNRPWSGVDAMNNALIQKINACVGMNDELYILGDFSYKIPKDEAGKLRERIVCRNVHLIRGNHDGDWDGTDAFSTVSDYAEIKTDERRIVMSHYPFAAWNGEHRGAIMLHGHVHGKMEDNISNSALGYLRFDMGVDANAYAPVSLDEVLEWAELAR